jgi:Superinfection immunity protein
VITLLFLAVIVLYFFPTFVARGCRHKHTLAIFVLNLLLGWTLLGWILAFIWSCVGERRAAVIVQTDPVQPDPTVWDRAAIYGQNGDAIPISGKFSVKISSQEGLR